MVVKMASRTVLHKSDVGGVALNLQTPEEARSAARAMLERLQSAGLADTLEGFVVEEMITGPGAEFFVGVVTDPLFGPLLACGAGGAWSNCSATSPCGSRPSPTGTCAR